MMILTVQILITTLFLNKNVLSYEYQLCLHSDVGRTHVICFNSNWNIISPCRFFEKLSVSKCSKMMIIVPTCLLADVISYDIVPKAVQKVANFLPQRWLLDTIAKLQQGIPFAELYLNIFILFAFCNCILLNCDL